MGLGHAFEISPDIRNGFLFELAQAQLTREIFPNAPLKYMPPTKFMTGDIFMGNVQNALFNAVTIMTGQNIHLLGMLTEAIHTPFLCDRTKSVAPLTATTLFPDVIPNLPCIATGQQIGATGLHQVSAWSPDVGWCGVSE